MAPRRLLPVLAALACACVAATLVVGLAPRHAGDTAAGHRKAAGGETRAGRQPGPRAVLAEWDRARARAWADGDPAELAELYTAGSGAGAADVRLLRDYLDRGLTVDGLASQVLALEVVTRRPRRLVLDVTDRVVGGRAVGGGVPVALPVGRAATRRVVLARSGDVWRVAEVRAAQPSAAASTSRTSSSSKS